MLFGRCMLLKREKPRGYGRPLYGDQAVISETAVTAAIYYYSNLCAECAGARYQKGEEMCIRDSDYGSFQTALDLDAAGNCAAYYGAQHQFPGRRNPGCSGSEDQNLNQVVISTHKRRIL